MKVSSGFPPPFLLKYQYVKKREVSFNIDAFHTFYPFTTILQEKLVMTMVCVYEVVCNANQDLHCPVSKPECK